MLTWKYSVQAPDTVLYTGRLSRPLIVFSVSRGRLFSDARKAKALRWISPPIPHPGQVARVGDEATGKALWTPVLLGGMHGMDPGRVTQRSPHTLKRNGVAAPSGNTLPWKRLDVGLN